MASRADPDEVEALARAFATHLRHLRDFRGVAYVGAGPLPLAEPSPAVEPPTASEPSPISPQRSPQQSTQSDKTVRNESPQPNRSDAALAAAGSSASPMREAQRKVLRQQAEQWTAERKLGYLRERHIGDCQRCPLAKTRRHIVFGVGDPEADLMFIGEAPGADEDRLGEPFVGAAGRRLDEWIVRLGLTREQVYIANVIKCRPPRNRDPKALEIERCSPFLRAQIRAIEPKVIVALGRFAGCLLLGRERKMYEMRGQLHRYVEPKSKAEVPLVVTYHPSYVIRRESEGRAPRDRTDRGGAIKSEDEKVFADLQRAASLLPPRT